MMLLIISSIMLNIMFFFSSNPLIMGFMLITQTVSLSILLGLMQKSFWFLYILILIFIGGMLVMFIYMTSILPNKKLLIFNNKIKILIPLTILLFSLMYFLNNFLLLNIYFKDINMFLNMKENMLLDSTIKIFNSSSSGMTIFLVNYLFYCMIIVIKMVNFSKGPLRMTTYV
nr:NADH dehydrogenase subunit 6 [Anomopsocus sp. AnspLA]